MKVWVFSLIVTSGLLLILFGVILKLQFPSIMEGQLEKKLIIREDSPTLGNFISPPIPIYMQFFFFNITNPEEIMLGARPKLVEIGPYTYLEKRTKHDLKWMQPTVEYDENVKFFFDASMSGTLTEDDMITTMNPVLMTLASKLDNPKVPEAMHGMFQMVRLRFDLQSFITKRVGDLLFKGYREDLLLELAKMTNDPIHKTGRFGFFYPKNDTDGGTYVVGTGAAGLESLQLISSWKGEPNLSYWPAGSSCNKIDGTTGSQFPQPIIPERNISMFSSDLCRSMYLSFEKIIPYGGLELQRYSLPYEVLADTDENQCFCSDDFTCRASMVNLSPCRNGAPVVASTPHFYMGDEATIAAVEGLNPSKEYHDTFIDVEPNTGVSFTAMKRIQISMPLRRYQALPELSNITEVIIPLLWLNESAKVPEESARQLHLKLSKPLEYVLYACIALFAIGGVMVIVSCVFFFKNSKKKKTSSNATMSDTKIKVNLTDDPKEKDPLRSDVTTP